MLIGWGRIELELASPVVISLGGTSRALIFIVFAAYLAVRARKADIKGLPSLADPLTLFCAFCALSVITGAGGEFSLFAMNLLPALLAYYIIRYLLSGMPFESHMRYMRVLVIFVVLIVVRGFADVKTNFFVNPTIMSTSAEHHTLVAMMLMAGLPLALALFFFNGRKDWCAIPLLAVMTVGMIVANSRIGWLALMAVALYLFLSMKERSSRAAILSIVAVMAILFFFFFPHLHRRFLTLFNMMADSDFVARLEIWHLSLLMAWKHLFLGIGFSEKQYMAEGALLKQGFSCHHPHNLLLAIPVYTGLPGLALFGWLLYRIIAALRELGKSPERQVQVMTMALKASFLSLFIVNMADSMFNSPRPTLMSFLLMGILFSLSELLRKKEVPRGPVKIAYLIGTLGRGGAEGQLLELICRLPRERFDPLLVVLKREGDLESRCREMGITPCYLGFRGFFSTLYPWNLAALLWNSGALVVKMARERYRVIHGYLFISYIIAAFLGTLAGVPVIVGSRRSMGSSKTRSWNWLHRLLEIMANRWTDMIVANSRAVMEDTIVRESLPPEKVTFIYNGVDPERFTVRPGEEMPELSPPIPDNAVVVGMVANLIHYKNHMMLLRALPLVREKVPAVHALLIGKDSGIQEELEAFAAEQGIQSCITFAGPRHDIPTLLSLLTVSVLTSREEGFPNALLESMAAALPVVATRVGGIPEVVDEGETAFLVDSDDHVALAQRLTELLSDPHLARAMGEKGKERVRALFSMEAMVASTEALYMELLEKKGFSVREAPAQESREEKISPSLE